MAACLIAWWCEGGNSRVCRSSERGLPEGGVGQGRFSHRGERSAGKEDNWGLPGLGSWVRARRSVLKHEALNHLHCVRSHTAPGGGEGETGRASKAPRRSVD